MSPALRVFIEVDLPGLLAITFAGVACAIPGSLLVLRRESMTGDAVSHAVLPGLVGAFLLSGSRDWGLMLAGAACAGVACVVASEALRRLTRMEAGLASGVVFSVMFALGVLLLRSAEHVDLDPDCVLYGQVESIAWSPARDAGAFWTWRTWLGDGSFETMPRQVAVLAGAACAIALAVGVFFKEIVLASFDAGLATTLGLRPRAVSRGLVVLVALAAVVAFEAVGSVLVIALMVCPGATARLLTDRAGRHVMLSAGLGAGMGLLGYACGAWLPGALGFDRAVVVSGAASCVGGAMFVCALVLAPRHGLLAEGWRRAEVRRLVLREDVLGALYRAAELGRAAGLDAVALRRVIGSGPATGRALRRLAAAGLVRQAAGGWMLTPAGEAEAKGIVRAHRLWELYLVRELGLRPDHVHDPASELEHLRAGGKRVEPKVAGTRDPHDRAIPGATEEAPG
ncbi:MAG: metal ABC transporter permease [Phycisphaerales bacterium]|nr:metal ABC transporter permease [Phycisphaerales bacterium]